MICRLDSAHLTCSAALRPHARRLWGVWRGVSGWSWVLIIALAVVVPRGEAVAGGETGPSEEQLKAAFLLNFPKYVEWPEGAFTSATAPIRVAVVGDTKVEKALREISSGKSIAGRPVEIIVVRAETAGSVECHILFVSSSESREARALLERSGRPGVLTVGESDGFLEQGGVINLARRDRKIRLEVSLAAARDAHLKISSKLLSVAEVVKGKGG